MGFLTDDFLDLVLDALWGDPGDVVWTPPATWYIALFEVMPDTDGTGGTEASYTDYDRAAVANDLTNWPAASAGLKSNAGTISYGVAGSGPTNVVGFGFYDDPTAGDLWAAVELTGAPVTINNGADVSFQPGAIDLTRCA